MTETENNASLSPVKVSLESGGGGNGANLGVWIGVDVAEAFAEDVGHRDGQSRHVDDPLHEVHNLTDVSPAFAHQLEQLNTF